MTKKAITFVILCSLIIGGFGGWIFDRYLIPKINTLPFLVKYNLAPQTAPLIINRREEIRVNEGSDSIAAIQKVKPWLVGIISGADLAHAQISGSGIVLTSDGLVAVSKNSLPKNSPISLSFQDGTVLPATVSSLDPSSDLAFLKVAKNNLPTASLGYSKDLQLGQRIIVLSPTQNEFQAVDKVSYLGSEVKNLVNRTYFSDAINQTFKVDELSNVSDGSMILSLDGNVQGIYSSNNVITADTIRSALNGFFSSGKITRNQIGFYFSPISKTLAGAFGGSQGALIRKTDPKIPAVVLNSPAAKAGLLEGDLITSVNGTNVDIDNSIDDLLQKAKPGDTLQVNIIRNKLPQTLSLVVGAQ
jgi:serine protease Do